MKAVTTLGNGAVSVTEVPDPVVGHDEVLVRVAAATVNPVDTYVANGLFHAAGVIAHTNPVGLGWDLVGEVAEVGEDVDGLAIGDRVAGVRTGFDTPVGALAEYLSVSAVDLAPVPDGLDDLAAASIGMNALTAAQALDLFGDAGGRRLLVTGAAGALGGFAVELAVDAGWQVTGLARAADAEFLAARGAALVTELGDTTYDAVLDAAGLQDAVIAVTAPGGTFVGVMPGAPLPEAPGRTVSVVDVRADGERLAGLLKRADAGQLTSRLAGSVPLLDAAEAFDAVAAPGGRGRWIVVIR